MPLVSFLPPENIRKPLVFLGFQTVLKETGHGENSYLGYLEYVCFHFAAVNSENKCVVFATMKTDVRSHPYLKNKVYIFINPFHATGIFLYPLKTEH